MVRELSKFLIVGSCGLLVDGLAFYILDTMINVHAARIIAFIVAVHTTYFLNSKFTFYERKGNLFWYCLGQSKGFLLNFIAFEVYLYFSEPSSTNLTIAFLLGSFIAMWFNFFYAKFIAFSTKE